MYFKPIEECSLPNMFDECENVHVITFVNDVYMKCTIERDGDKYYFVTKDGDGDTIDLDTVTHIADARELKLYKFNGYYSSKGRGTSVVLAYSKESAVDSIYHARNDISADDRQYVFDHTSEHDLDDFYGTHSYE